MCDCHSYNADKGKTPEVILDPRKYFPHYTKNVSVDACIASQIELLWEHGIETGGSCCGHNGLFGEDFPSVVVDNKEVAMKALRVLRTNDPKRSWQVKYHALISINTKGDRFIDKEQSDNVCPCCGENKRITFNWVVANNKFYHECWECDNVFRTDNRLPEVQK